MSMCCLQMLSTAHTAMRESRDGWVLEMLEMPRAVECLSRRVFGWALVCVVLQATASTPLGCSRERTTQRQTTNSSSAEQDCRRVRSFVQRHVRVHRLCFLPSACDAASVQRTEDSGQRTEDRGHIAAAEPLAALELSRVV
jgi:hypothetical protein